MASMVTMDSGMLVVVKGYNQGLVFKLGSRNLTAGRDSGNLIQLIDREVSRRHCLIRKANLGYKLLDLNSANGTCVNGKLVQEADLAVGDVIKLGDTYLQLTTFKDSIPDAVTGGKITDPRVAGAITAQSDSPGWQTPEPAPASSYAVTPSPDDVSTFSSTDRPIIDTDELHRARKSDMAVIFDRMRMEEEYLELATETLHRFICPDRAVILKKTEQKRLASERVFLNPALDPAHHQSPPVLPLVKRAMKTRRVAMDNKVESPPDQQLAASALVVPVLQGDEAVGAVYIDCFPRSRKIFMETDFELLERIAEVLAIRWNEG